MQSRFRRIGWVVVGLAGIAARGAAADEPKAAPLFPFVLPWDDAAPSVVARGGLLERPAGKRGPVVVRDGHLFTGPNRLRLFGVNLCFGADFPRPDDSAKIAARLAKFGVNCVRFHHMDMQPSPNGIFAADGRTLDPGQLDKLDALIARLKEHGIYADLNLHVSRTYPGLPTWEGMPDFHKAVDNFEPRMIDLQRRYARELLTHRNPYTGTRYVDEPAVALVEINNENALLSDWWGGRLDAMPAVYADELTRQWNAWLATRHPDFAALKKEWEASASPLGAELLKNGDFAAGLNPWALEQSGEAKATAEAKEKSLRIAVRQPGREGWHVQLNQGKLAFDKGKPYTIAFRARADAPRRIVVNAMQAHGPWRQLWSTEVRLTTDWQDVRLTFRPVDGDPDARITFSNLGTEAGTIGLADVSLRPGGIIGLAKDDGPGHVGILTKSTFARRTEAVQRDWVRFLYDIEERYWTGMYRFLKDDLQVKAPIVGTQMGWSPFPIQARLDVIDSHSYWQHPDFHGRGWNEDHWTVNNVPMTGAADGGTLPRLALSRVAGKPFICTEYNHSAPNTYSSEAFPLLAAFAAMQDWDGIFAFAYSHRRDEWDARKITSFFDIDQHPAKMVTLPAASTLFLRGDLAPAETSSIAYPTRDQVIDAIARSGPGVGAGDFGVGRATALRERVGVAVPPANDSAQASAIVRPGPDSAPSSFHWPEAGQRRLVTIASPRSRAAIGAAGSEPIALGDVGVTVGPTRQGWAALTLTALDGPDFRAPGRILVTATGDAENTATGWKDAAKSTVGRDWGQAPSLVEGIPATINLPVAAVRAHAWALDERGRRKGPLKVRDVEGNASFAIGPEWKTLWYEVEIQAVGPPSAR